MANLFKHFKQNTSKDKLLNISHFLGMTASFFVLALFISLVITASTLIDYFRNQVQVTIYFKDDFPEAKIIELKNQVSNEERVESVKYISKNDAYEIFKVKSASEPILLDSASPETLPASLEIKTKKLADLNELARLYETKDGVESIKFFSDIVNRFIIVSKITYYLGLSLIVIFFAYTYTAILTLLRLTINARGTEYGIMKLVGASDKYVKRPLLFQGAVFGLTSSLLAGTVFFVITFVLFKLNFIRSTVAVFGLVMHPMLYSLFLVVFLGLCGFCLGYFGSQSAVKKYLDY